MPELGRVLTRQEVAEIERMGNVATGSESIWAAKYRRDVLALARSHEQLRDILQRVYDKTPLEVLTLGDPLAMEVRAALSAGEETP